MKEALPWAYFLVSFPYLNSESLNTVGRLTLVQAVALVQVQHSEERYLSYHHVSSLAALPSTLDYCNSLSDRLPAPSYFRPCILHSSAEKSNMDVNLFVTLPYLKPSMAPTVS